mgnify:CR=1 FL=1
MRAIITIILGAKMIFLLILAFKNQLSAQMRKPLEFLVGLLMLILNNSFYLYGIYLLAILSVDDNPLAAKEYLISTGMVLTSWGLLNVFGGGLYELGRMIETGELEAYLSKPRSPLFLAALSKSNFLSLAEVVQGVITIIVCSIFYGPLTGITMLASSCVLVFAFASVIIVVGALSFFSSRGSQLSYVVMQVVLSLSLFPVGRALKGREKWILCFSPLLITATLPRASVIQGGFEHLLVFIAATTGCFLMSVAFFNFGLKFYKSKNMVSLNE